MIEIVKKNKAVVLYLLFGVLTTVVNIAVYAAAAHLLRLGTTSSNVIAWIIAVTFAYLTNRKWVFESGASTGAEITKELISFYSCRLATGVLDIGIMYVFVDLLFVNDLVMKVLSNVLVIILNYIASKLVIFKKKQEEI